MAEGSLAGCQKQSQVTARIYAQKSLSMCRSGISVVTNMKAAYGD